MATYSSAEQEQQNSQYAPSDQFPNPQQPQTTTQQQQKTGGSLQDILGRYTYGAAGLGQAENELNAAGYQLQKDSQGRVRGRLKASNGDIIDVIGQGEGNDWWNNQTGTSWNIQNRGQEGLDAGGWSFGGANSPGYNNLATPTNVQAPPLQPAGGGGDTDPFGGNGVKLPNGQWVPKDHPLAQGQPGNAQGPPLQPGQPGAESDSDMLMRLLRERAGQDLNIDANNPIIRNQVDNFRASQERDRIAHQNENAEMAAARGMGSSSALETQNRMGQEQSALNTSNFQAQLIGRELQSRRDEIQHALDSMGARLSETERQALQRELAKADNDLRRYGIDTQNSQFYAGLSQSDRHFYDQLAQTGRLADMDNAYRYAQMGQQGQQFADTMGFNIGDRQAYWDAVRRGQL